MVTKGASGAMRWQLTAGLSSKLDDLVARHSETKVLAAFEAMEGERITAREYIFGAENALNRAHQNAGANGRSLNTRDGSPHADSLDEKMRADTAELIAKLPAESATSAKDPWL